MVIIRYHRDESFNRKTEPTDRTEPFLTISVGFTDVAVRLGPLGFEFLKIVNVGSVSVSTEKEPIDTEPIDTEPNRFFVSTHNAIARYTYTSVYPNSEAFHPHVD